MNERVYIINLYRYSNGSWHKIGDAIEPFNREVCYRLQQAGWAEQHNGVYTKHSFKITLTYTEKRLDDLLRELP